LVAALPSSAHVVIDGYHGFCAVPTDLAVVGQRAFYLAGGYKYAMAGEGACFLQVPASVDVRPRNTGWFAAFGALEEKASGAVPRRARDEREVVRVPFATGGARFFGATFDPSGLYRLNAAMRWRAQVGLTTLKTREHAHALQRRFLLGADAAGLVVTDERRGQFLTFRREDARARCAQLKTRGVKTDARDDRLRFGFGVYQDEADVDRLLAVLR
jgi:selenocysteine lyase/cysteine desulfurase